MWYGKIAIIMTVFSISVSWGMYELSTVYTLPSTNFAWTESHIKAMAGNYSAIQNLNNGQNPSAALIFGDFIVGITVLLNALALAGNAVLGGGLASILQGIPGIDYTTTLLIQILYGSSEVFLWIYVIANRSI